MPQPYKMRALRSVLQGISVLDMPRLEVDSMVEAERFVSTYGIDTSQPVQWVQVQSIYRKSFYFLFDYLLEERSVSVDLPSELTQPSDLYKLLMQASRSPEVDEARMKSLWTCALLRICHALLHAEYDWRNRFFPLVEKTIVEPIRSEVHVSASGTKWLGTPESKSAVRIVDFNYRLEKPFESRLMKLLHKPQLVAQDIFDRVGLRFITQRKIDAVRIMHYLLEKNLINIAHLLPKRSRNTLFDTETALVLIDEWDGASEEQLDRLEERLPTTVKPRSDNEVSSDHYKACHITLRQMVGTPDEKFGTYRFFMPYEIQIMDQVSYQDSILGYSSHDDYKSSQKVIVLKRVLGDELFSRTLPSIVTAP